MTNFKIFGQEPAFFVGVLEALLATFLTFGWFSLDQEHVSVIVAFVTAAFGLLTAWTTKNTLLAALVGFAKAALVLAAAYGLTLTDGQTSSLIALITIAASGWLRSKTSSTNTVISEASPGDVQKVQNVVVTT